MRDERDAWAPVIETGRLVLRPLSGPDAEALHRISNEPLVRRYLWDDEPVSRTKIGEIIARSERMFSAEGLGLFGVRLRSGEELVGFCGFMRVPGGPGEIELVYGLMPELRGRDIATESARACLCYAFLEVGLDRVIAGVDAPNVASSRVIEKLGMRPVGEIFSQSGVVFFVLEKRDFGPTEAAGNGPGPAPTNLFRSVEPDT